MVKTTLPLKSTAKMLDSIKKLFIYGALGLFCSVSLVAQNQYFKEFGDQPVKIQQRNNGNVQTLTFVAFRDGMLVAELQGGVGEVSLPVNNTMVRGLRLALNNLKLVNDQIDIQNYEEALKLLRPEVYPLIKFYQLPDAFTQLHSAIQTLFETLVKAGELEEAEQILSKMDLSKASLVYNKDAIILMNQYLDKKQYADAARITQIMPLQGKYAANISPVMAAADKLRAAGNYADVIPLYQSIENVVSEDNKANIRMWLAYCLVLADRLDEALPMIEALVEPQPKEQLFSLYKLLQGSLEYRQEEYTKALDVLTRGFVRAQASYSWVPEMLYMIGDCYLKSDDSLAARNVWKELVTLYPDSLWSKKATDGLNTLPKLESNS